MIKKIQSSVLNIGVRAHDYGQGTPSDIATIIGKFDVNCVQLAPAKSFPTIGETTGQLSVLFAQEVKRAFAAQNIAIAVLGCYINPIHPNPAEREIALLRFEEHLRFASDFGCNIVGTETGSRNANCTYHPDNISEEAFSDLVKSIKRLAKTAEEYDTLIGIEGVAHHHVINTYDKMAQLLNAVDSPNVKIIYDPVNFFPLDQCENQQALMDEAFALFGDQIVAIHCKDYEIVEGMKTGDLPTGTGKMDNQYLLSILRQKMPNIQIILESTHPKNIEGILEFMQT